MDQSRIAALFYQLRDLVAHYKKALAPVVIGAVAYSTYKFGVDAELTIALGFVATAFGVGKVRNIEKQSHPTFHERKFKG